MIRIDIPGYKMVELHHLLLDFNGTIAKDGILIPGVLERLEHLSQELKVHVLTADTHGSAHAQCDKPYITLHIIGREAQDLDKQAYLRELEKETCAAIGNGRNDRLMLSEAAIGIALLQTEGLASATLGTCDLLFSDINDALDALLNPKRLIATLRNQ